MMKKYKPTNNTFSPGARVTLAICLAVLAAGIVYLVTPQGRVWAQGVLQFFTRGDSNPIPGATKEALVWVEQTPGLAAATLTPQPAPPGPEFEAECGGYANPRCSLEEIRSKVRFTVLQFAQIPQGWAFTGATGGSRNVHLAYRALNGRVLLLTQEPWTASLDQSPWEVGASAVIEMVPVGGVTAGYVKGSYASDGGRSPAQWDANAPVQNLRWVDQGILFTLQLVGADPQLNRDGLAALAGSLTIKVAATVTIAPVPTAKPTVNVITALKERYPLTVEQAARKSLLILHQPVKLPDGLRLFGAHYEEAQKTVTIFYHFDPGLLGATTDGLALTQQLAPVGEDCALCGFVPGA
ncbi:MAG: hypothetical protein IH586_09775, partial [Anaerolineaceae bacterium]|nr:hypothetical protein [Anaerolineaceae bacterium]